MSLLIPPPFNDLTGKDSMFKIPQKDAIVVHFRPRVLCDYMQPLLNAILNSDSRKMKHTRLPCTIPAYAGPVAAGTIMARALQGTT